MVRGEMLSDPSCSHAIATGEFIQMKKRFMALFLSATLLVGAASCSNAGQAASSISAAASTGQAAATTFVQMSTAPAAAAPAAVATTAAAATAPVTVDYDSADLEGSAGEDEAVAATITLAGDSIRVDGSGVSVDGSVANITAAGRYAVSGVLNDGQLVVDTKDAENIVLELNGVDITNSAGPAIYVANAEKVVLALADGTQNTVTDGETYVYPDTGTGEEATDEPDAVIFSHDDLTINGAGQLIVNANYNNGITSKDDLKITGGAITVNATNDGIKGRDSVAIKDGTITIKAGGDGLQANNDEDAAEGYIVIEGGTLDITAAMDGIQAETRLDINGGNITVSAGGGSAAGKGAESGKGLKAGVDIAIAGGNIQVDAGDDALNANNSVTIDGGELTLATGDDGIRANLAFTLNGGAVNITTSYEGVEGETITINDGELRLASRDDGINGSDSAAAAGAGMGGPGMEMGNSHLYINGGYVAVDAGGDGLDVNGPIDMTGGTVLVNGPTGNNNGALDYGGSFNVTGGLLVAAGSAGMAQAPSATSTQYTLAQTFSSVQAAGTLVHVVGQDGYEVVTFAPGKSFQSIVVSSPALVKGGTYTIYAGGKSTGLATDGLVSGGTYTGGQQVASYTLDSVVTGAAGGMGPGMGGPGMAPGMAPGGRRRP